MVATAFGPHDAGMDDTTTARLRTILRLDALLGVASGLLLLGAAGPVARLVEAGSPAILRWVGAGLVLYGVDLAIAATRRRATVRTATITSALADGAWVAGSVALVATGALGPAGLVAALPVAAFGLTKAVVLQAEPSAATAVVTSA